MTPRLTKQHAGLLRHYAQNPDQVDPRKLEEMADHLLGLRDGRPGRKLSCITHPVLSERQRKARLDKEMPLGGLIEVITANPAGRFSLAPTTQFDPNLEFPETPEWGWCDEDLDESWEVAA